MVAGVFGFGRDMISIESIRAAFRENSQSVFRLITGHVEVEMEASGCRRSGEAYAYTEAKRSGRSHWPAPTHSRNWYGRIVSRTVWEGCG